MTHHTTQSGEMILDKTTLAEVMKQIDICMMTTEAADGHMHSRPMSNNRNVEWDGTSWFFSNADTPKAEELGHNPKVNLAYSLTEDMVYISLAGRVELVYDDAKKRELWYDGLDRWFPNGPDDDNVVLIKVIGEHARYWSKEGSGELKL
jgi:general stress protein 26